MLVTFNYNDIDTKFHIVVRNSSTSSTYKKLKNNLQEVYQFEFLLWA